MEVLRRLGVDGRTLGALQSLYANATVAMKIGDRTGQSLPSRTGLKQGCPLSPTLFGLFSDGLHRHLLQRCPGVGPRLRCGTRVPDLGYADDFALLAYTPADLQRLVDAAAEFCEQTGMLISADKSKVLPSLTASQDLISGIVLAQPLSGSNNFGTWAQYLTAARALTVHMAVCTRRCGARGRSFGADTANCSVPCLWACCCGYMMHVCRPQPPTL